MEDLFLFLCAVRFNLDDPEWSNTELTKSGSLRFNYHLCLEYGNSKKSAIIKAILGRIGLRICLAKDMPASLMLWYLLIEFNQKFLQ